MASPSDTLNIGSIRLRKEYPVAEVQSIQSLDPVIHPAAAAAARARIAAIQPYSTMVRPETVPAAPTADLITDKDVLARRITAEPIVARPNIPSALTPVLTAIGIFALVLLLFKAPIVISQLGYSLGPKPSSAPAIAASTAVVPAANTITIPKINVHAPVNYVASIQEADIQNALQSGVVHYGNTALPGQIGNVAIFGHSSNDWWEPGNFKFVFVLLDKLAPGDLVSLDYQSVRYTYQVTGSQIVDPTDVAVLNPTSTATLSLITCTPPGTSLRRLVVTAKQIDPDPTKAAQTVAPTTTQAPTSLTSSAPDIFTQLSQAWNGIVHGFSSLFGTDNTPAQPAGSAATTTEIPATK